MKIRGLINSDLDQVTKLLVNSFSPRYNNPPIIGTLSNPKSIFIVVEINNIIVGVASLHIIEKLTRKMGLIEDVAVDSKHRGKGIGIKLIQNLTSEAKNMGCDKIVLSSSKDNISFYEKSGFKVNEVQMVLRNN
jgi:N-acetylglutamate synthase-like GNAT family acetyltransferase|tara:strand:- start:1239 stop:1640 length:402 start_codon:yes stop_codon:yes gene_type:complete